MGAEQEIDGKEHLLLLHGALGAASQMEPLGAELSDKYHVHCLDFTGHGGKTEPVSFSIDRFAYDVIRYLDDHLIAQTHIFGFSMGGYVALKVAERLGLRIGKIITLGTKFDWSPETAEHETRLLDPDRIQEKVPGFASMLQERHAPANWKKIVEQTAVLMQDLGQNPQWKPGINIIHNATYLMVGALDNMVTIDETRQVADQLPNGTFQIIPDMEHPFEKTDLDVLSEMIQSFLESDIN
ncbi:MAG: alpha/beta hydrolase [Cyclobacteriaceae bacterium]